MSPSARSSSEGQSSDPRHVECAEEEKRENATGEGDGVPPARKLAGERDGEVEGREKKRGVSEVEGEDDGPGEGDGGIETRARAKAREASVEKEGGGAEKEEKGDSGPKGKTGKETGMETGGQSERKKERTRVKATRTAAASGPKPSSSQGEGKRKGGAARSSRVSSDDETLLDLSRGSPPALPPGLDPALVGMSEPRRRTNSASSAQPIGSGPWKEKGKGKSVGEGAPKGGVKSQKEERRGSRDRQKANCEGEKSKGGKEGKANGEGKEPKKGKEGRGKDGGDRDRGKEERRKRKEEEMAKEKEEDKTTKKPRSEESRKGAPTQGEKAGAASKRKSDVMEKKGKKRFDDQGSDVVMNLRILKKTRA